MTTRTPQQAIDAARRTKTFEEGHCLVFVRTMFNVPAAFASAADAWVGAELKHPAGSGAEVPRGRTGLLDGWQPGLRPRRDRDRHCWSSDAGGPGRTAKVRIDELTERWAITFRGWTEDLNNVRVYDAREHARRPDRPRVKIKQLRPDPREDVREVQKALRQKLPGMAEKIPVDGYFGPATQEAYAAWQRRCGFSGSDADGLPGRISLQRLGFAVA